MLIQQQQGGTVKTEASLNLKGLVSSLVIGKPEPCGCALEQKHRFLLVLVFKSRRDKRISLRGSKQATLPFMSTWVSEFYRLNCVIKFLRISTSFCGTGSFAFLRLR